MFLWSILFSNANMKVAENLKGDSDSERVTCCRLKYIGNDLWIFFLTSDKTSDHYSFLSSHTTLYPS